MGAEGPTSGVVVVVTGTGDLVPVGDFAGAGF